MQVMEYLEDEKARMEAVMKVNELQNRLTHVSFDFAQNRRSFLREGMFLCEDPRYVDLTSTYVFLLSDILLITFPRGNKFKCSHMLPLYSCAFEPVPNVSIEEEDGEVAYYGFSVKQRKDKSTSLKLYVNNMADRDNWLAVVAEAQQDDNDLWQCREAEQITAKLHTSDSVLLRQVIVVLHIMEYS